MEFLWFSFKTENSKIAINSIDPYKAIIPCSKGNLFSSKYALQCKLMDVFSEVIFIEFIAVYFLVNVHSIAA